MIKHNEFEHDDVSVDVEINGQYHKVLVTGGCAQLETKYEIRERIGCEIHYLENLYSSRLPEVVIKGTYREEPFYVIVNGHTEENHVNMENHRVYLRPEQIVRILKGEKTFENVVGPIVRKRKTKEPWRKRNDC